MKVRYEKTKYSYVRCAECGDVRWWQQLFIQGYKKPSYKIPKIFCDEICLDNYYNKESFEISKKKSRKVKRKYYKTKDLYEGKYRTLEI